MNLAFSEFNKRVSISEKECVKGIVSLEKRKKINKVQ